MAGPPRVIAHRGASATWPEHSRAAYEQAIADGADGLECDVRLTADGVAVCWHDADVDRCSDGTGPVRDHSLAQMRALAAGGQLLTLAELLDLAAGAGRPVHVAIELKHPVPYGWAAEDAVLKVLGAVGWDPSTGGFGDVGVSLMSFHPLSLTYLAERGVAPRDLMVLLDAPAAPDPVELRDAVRVAEALSPGGAGAAAPAEDLVAAVLAELGRLADLAGRMADEGTVGGVGPAIALLRADPDRVRRWTAAGRLVRVWTVDAPHDVDLCRALGVAEITTNDPAAVLTRLALG